MLSDGIYFGLPFEMYLSEERVSSGAISDAIESPSAFWANSWMNPDRPEDEDSLAKKLGRAYHCARLEPEDFHERYCRQLVQSDFEGETLLTNATEIGNALADLGETKKKTGESVLDQAMRLNANGGFVGRIWSVELATWEVETKGNREAIDPKHWDEILRDQQRLRMNPEIARQFDGGLPEVSVFWTDERTGLPCKMRPDWLKPESMNHLKTWDMMTRGKPGNQAVAEKFGYDYLWTGWFYLMGAEWLRTAETMAILRYTGKDKDGDPEFAKATQDQLELVRLIREREAPLETWFTFVRRSGIPDIRARRIKWFTLPKGVEEQSIGASTEKFRHTLTGLGRKAEDEVNAAMTSVAEGLELFGATGSPWFPRDLVGEIDDDDFSDFFLDSRKYPR